MKYEVLFIQGAGEETVAMEEPVVNLLHKSLGPDYHIRHPLMPEAGNPRYEAWKESIKAELAAAKVPVILLGHSLGGSVLLKMFAHEPVPANVPGLVLMGMPFWGAEDWKLDEFAISEAGFKKLSSLSPVYLYHSRDDEQVPFTHLEMYQEVLPLATVRIFSDTDHSYSDAVAQLSADIKALAALTEVP